MLIKKKLSVVALVIASAVSVSAFAESETLKDPKFVEDSSYALGVLMEKISSKSWTHRKI